jgi:hypothetical protein
MRKRKLKIDARPVGTAGGLRARQKKQAKSKAGVRGKLPAGRFTF